MSPPAPPPPAPGAPAAFSHLFADFAGVSASQLRDASLLSGLMIAAAGAAGFNADGAPIVRILPHDALAAIMTIDAGCHMAVHTFPERGTLLLDVLAPSTFEARKALDVFTRRITATSIRSEQRARG